MTRPGTPSSTPATPIGNAKGKLFEYCARARLPPPATSVEQGGAQWGVTMRLALPGRCLESERRWPSALGAAEQLAAPDLLEQLARESEAEPDELVSAVEEAELRRDNPKGKLLERCAALRLTPVFDVRAVLSGNASAYEASVVVTLPGGEELFGELRCARNAKTAEQATAASHLGRLDESPRGAAAEDPPRPAEDARSRLNELRLGGVLRDYGPPVEHVEGPAHAPVFHVKGFAVRRTGERVEIGAILGASKKEAEKLAAAALLTELRSAAAP